jgi:thioredoxin reductase
MKKVELAVIGAGPAGLSAAIESAKNGVNVIVFDENKRPGGQLFKQIHKFFGSKAHMAGIRGFKIGEILLEEANKLEIPVFLDSPVIGMTKDKVVAFVHNEKIQYIRAEKILVATGAMENVIQFPGWTLPGVMGAGAVQTMINIERVLPGRKVLMIGAGNVGLIVSYQLMQAGADVVALVEAKPEINGYGVHASKIRRAGVPIYLQHTIVCAKGKKSVEKAVIARIDDNFKLIAGTEKELTVDLICLAVGLSPLVELINFLDCKQTYIAELGGWIPLHDENMETTCKGVYVAGDVSSIEEASSALDKGKIAGIAIAESLNYISHEVASKKLEKIRKSLNELRCGPFGEKILQGNEKIFDAIRRWKNEKGN